MASRQTKEIPFVDLFRPVSKWATLIVDPAQTQHVIRRAFMQMSTARPGPVAIGIPVDVAGMKVPDTSYAAVTSRVRCRSAGDPSQIDEAVQLIVKARRPYLYVGAGVLFSEATDELVRFAELLTLPVATTLNGKSAFPEDNPLSLGIGGFARASYSSLAATVLAERADVIITIGCGFKQHATLAWPGSDVQHIQIDVDPAELNRDHLADVTILGDARLVLRQLTEAARSRGGQVPPDQARLAEIGRLKHRWLEISEPLLTSDETPINPFRVTHELMKQIDPANTILLHDAGTVRGTTSQHYVAPTPRAFLGFGVQSAMGWSLGAAMGAKKARPDKLVVAVIGEEAFNETALDIETSLRNDAPILIVVKNNRRYVDQDGGKSKRLAHARFRTGMNIGRLTEALGGRAYRIERPGDLSTTLREAVAEVCGGTTAVVEVLTARVPASLHPLWETSE